MGNGESTCGFTRTLPYAGTEINKRLKQENRIAPGFRTDYKFNDPRLDTLHSWLYLLFNDRNNDPMGTRNLFSLSLFEASLDLPSHPFDKMHLSKLRALNSVSNNVMFDIIEIVLDYLESKETPPNIDDPLLRELISHHNEQDNRIREDFNKVSDIRYKLLSNLIL